MDLVIEITYNNGELNREPFTWELQQPQVEKLEQFLSLPDTSFTFLRDILMENAAEKGLTIPKIQLRDAQMKPVAMSYVNPRFFIGDKPGLGKTVMSAGCVALYQKQTRKKGEIPKKVMVVTDTSHVKGFAKEWQRFGLSLLELGGGKANIIRQLKKNELTDYDGVILNWDSLKTNSFIDFYAQHHQQFEIAIFDETSKLLNMKSTLYKITDNIVNTYKGGIPRVIFLNGSSFEKNIFDFYGQFNILAPKLIPTKTFLEKHFVIREGRMGVHSDFSGGKYMKVQHTLAYTGEIVDYRNQDILRDKLKYFYIARSKSDYAKDIPMHNYKLHLLTMTKKQAKDIAQNRNISKINSPATSDPQAAMTRKTLPKLDFLVQFVPTVIEDRPLIYVFNIEAQLAVKRELEQLGYRVAIVNGEQTIAERDDIINQFNHYQLDILIFNIRKAINLPTSERIIFWDIPTMPQQTSQIIGRIDRNNYEKGKFYDFLCYMNSPEMENMVRLAYFRETQASAFTGQREFVYETLQKQLEYYLSESNLVKVDMLLKSIDAGNILYQNISAELDKLLHIQG